MKRGHKNIEGRSEKSNDQSFQIETTERLRKRLQELGIPEGARFSITKEFLESPVPESGMVSVKFAKRSPGRPKGKKPKTLEKIKRVARALNETRNRSAAAKKVGMTTHNLGRLINKYPSEIEEAKKLQRVYKIPLPRRQPDHPTDPHAK